MQITPMHDLTKLAAIGLLLFVALVIILSHIGERDWKDRVNNWRKPE